MRGSTKPGNSKMFITGPHSKPHKCCETRTATFEHEGEEWPNIINYRKKRIYRRFW